MFEANEQDTNGVSEGRKSQQHNLVQEILRMNFVFVADTQEILIHSELYLIRMKSMKS